MKKYILMGQIADIGGWQLYMEARTDYLLKNGIDVYLVSIHNDKKDKLKLQLFEKTKHLCYPEVHMPPLAYNKRQQHTILDNLLSFINYQKGDEVFIEATDMWLSMWGELLAKRTVGKSFSYLLHSHIENISIDTKRFFQFKYQHNLLAGMSEKTLPELFDDYLTIPLNDERRLFAVPRDSLSDENDLQQLTNELNTLKLEGTKIICYFGNLTKPHFSELCTFLVDYFAKHNSNRFIFLTVGSSSKGKAEALQKSLEQKCVNCKSINVPSRYPVPRELFANINVCIASWGCSEDAARARAITIRLLDDKTIIPQGIMGITLKGDRFYMEKPSGEQLEKVLDDVLFMDKYSVDEIENLYEPRDYIEYNKIADKMMKPFEMGSEGYYDINLIQSINRRVSIERITNCLFGSKATLKLIEVAKIIISKNA